MALDAAHAAAKTIFTTANGPSYTFNGSTSSIDHRYSIGDDSSCIAYMNDLAVGTGQGKTVARATISGADVIAAIGASNDFAGMDATTLTKLQWLIQKDPVQIGDAKTASAIAGALQAYSDGKAAFDGLKARAGTVWESITGIDGAGFTQTDLSTIRAG